MKQIDLFFKSCFTKEDRGTFPYMYINVYLGPPVSNFMLRSKELNFLFFILAEGGWCAQCSLCYVLLWDCVLQPPQQCSCHTWSHRATGDHSTGPWRLDWHYTIGRPPYSPTILKLYYVYDWNIIELHGILKELAMLILHMFELVMNSNHNNDIGHLNQCIKSQNMTCGSDEFQVGRSVPMYLAWIVSLIRQILWQYTIRLTQELVC